MNLYTLGLNAYQRDLVNNGKVRLVCHPGPCYIATHRDGFEAFDKTARKAMDMLEVLMLQSQFELASHVENDDELGEFNDHGIDPGDGEW